MKKKIGMIVLLAVLAGGGVASYLFIWKGPEKDRNIVRTSGNIEITDAEVAFQIPGKVEARLVAEGEMCRSGQLIARLDGRELERETALRKAEVRAARARLAELEAGYRSEEIAKAEALLAKSRAEEARQKSDYTRDQTLFNRKVISQREFEASRAGYQVAAAAAREAEAELERLRNGPREEEIEQARAELERAREQLGLAETRLGYASLASPLSGLVLSENVEPGEYVSAGTPVVTVGDLVNVWLRGYINETDLGRVKVGRRAEITCDSYPGKRFEGCVSFISPEAEFTPKQVQTEQQRVKLVYRVKIDVKNPDMELKAGMPADAEIKLDQSCR
ncbi:efflux RND transporter periplasmic adaptor subunit [Desulfoferrobacter suflitae]|uniref:efflux RND transporter periplasmic adaptor subunit n=1 Tax=Desulfoferrobacter suflitae TaxID=2865782 RepID=UPI002164454A|nr:efflux RND transporter periplasmic adaptor subunit [Desulfoferrobacter suflitae]MCK8604296.1 efflux RND transporter periplasmic adaptor subunit [Desulfoferrobacter suflitae]